MLLECLHVKKSFNNTKVLEDINLSLNKGEIVTILGESGCGKSTLLRLILGLEKLNEGEIYIDKHLVASKSVHVEPNKRDFSMVFQDYALLPHLNVRQNILFSIPKLPKHKQNERLEYFSKLLKIDELHLRYIHELSGGQQQRVAVARALVCQPKLILFDEPFSNLDENLKQSLREELKSLIKKLNIGAIFVTHDKQDAFSISDKIALIKDGKVAQFGSPKKLYENPKSLFVAKHMGKMNLFTSNCIGLEKKCLVGARVEDCYFSENNDNDRCVEGKIIDITYAGSYNIVKLLIPSQQVITVNIPADMHMSKGEKKYIKVQENKIMTFNTKENQAYM